MEWWVWLMIVGMGLILFLATGMPIAFAFGILNSILLLVLSGGDLDMLKLVALSCYDSVSSFVFITVPLSRRRRTVAPPPELFSPVQPVCCACPTTSVPGKGLSSSGGESRHRAAVGHSWKTGFEWYEDIFIRPSGHIRGAPDRLRKDPRRLFVVHHGSRLSAAPGSTHAG